MGAPNPAPHLAPPSCASPELLRPLGELTGTDHHGGPPTNESCAHFADRFVTRRQRVFAR